MNIWDYGATLTQAKTKAGHLLLTPGLYAGFLPTLLGPNQLKLSSGCLLSPKGVIHNRPTEVTVPDFPVTSMAGTYTLQATHDDVQSIGGSEFQFRWVTGIQPRTDLATNAVSILYVRQSAGGALSVDQLSQPVPLQTGSLQALALPTSIGPEFTLFSSVTGPNITSSLTTSLTQAQYLGLRSTNSALSGLQTHSFRLLVPSNVRVRSIGVLCELPSLGIIACSGIAANGSTITFTQNAVNGPVTDLTTPTWLEASNNASPLVALSVTVTIPAGSSCFLHRVLLQVD